jgi:CRP/FNR family transcriptional regulator
MCSPCGAANRHVAALPDCAACDVRGYTFCSELADDEIGEVQAIVRQIRLVSGQLLFQEGDEAQDVFNVTQGIIKLYKLLPDGRRQITGFVFPGDFLGIVGSGGYSYSAEAVNDVTLCRLSRSQLYQLFLRFPKLEHRLFAIATDELTAAQDQMLLLGRKTAAEKLASFLLSLAHRADVDGSAAEPVPLPMNRGDIADYLGLTVETVSRVIGRMKRDGLIDLADAHHIVLARREALEGMAEGFD